MKFKYIYTSAVTLLLASSLSAQVISSSYFMDRSVHRHELNPALMPEENYFDVLIGNIHVNVNTPLSIERVLIPYQGQLVTPFYPDFKPGSPDYLAQFINSLSTSNPITSTLNYNLFSFGKKAWGGYISASVNSKVDVGFTFPKELIKFAAYGPNNTEPTTTNLGNAGVDMSMYTEIGLGYQRHVDQLLKGLTLGAKVKFLLGVANVSAQYTSIDLHTSTQKWSIQPQGSLRNASAIPLAIQNGALVIGDPSQYGGLFSGFGLAFDLGANYKLLDDQLNVSLAVTDLGFISWFNAQEGIAKGNEVGFTDISSINEELGKQIQEAFMPSEITRTSYTRAIRATLVAGAEYNLFKNRLGFGLLSRTTFAPTQTYEELTISANYRPFREIATTLSYSYLCGLYSSLGFALNVNPGPFNLFVGVDYIPMAWANPGIPIAANSVNLQFGISWNLR